MGPAAALLAAANKQRPNAISHFAVMYSLSSSFLEEQFAGAVRGLYYGFDEGDTELPFFQFEDAVDGAAGWRRHRVFQQGRVIAGFEDDAGCAFHGLRREQRRDVARQAYLYTGFGE